MNDTVRSSIIFVSGLALGFGLGYISFKSYFEKKADNEIESCKQMYKQREEEFNQVIGENSIENPTVKPDGGGMSGLMNATSSLDGPHPNVGTVDYTTHFKGKEGEEMVKKTKEELDKDVVKAEDCEHIDPAELETPDDEPLTEEEDGLEQEDYDMYLINEEHQAAVAENRPPYEIPESEFGNIPGYDMVDIYYYQIDNVLCDDNHEELDVPELFVGDLLETDFKDNDVSSIYLRSDVLMADIEVHKNSVDKFYNE